jgi:hypothetical protein
MFSTSVLLSALALSHAADITLEDFSKPIHRWVEKNDPVMGGQSVGTTRIHDDLLVFNGSVVDVPSLGAPGFITSESVDNTRWADVSGCKALSMTLRSTTEYSGYRISFGSAHATVCGKFFAYGYKSHFDAPADFGKVIIPFGNFSDCWDDATGDVIKTCAENSNFCPTQKALANFGTVSIWGEGIAGLVHLEVKEIAGTDCQ